MIKYLLAIVVWVLLSICGAQAQNTQCSDRPSTDSSNACANTRFVHQFIPAAVVNVDLYCTAAQRSADATACIQNAINAAEAIGSAEVFFPSTTYNLTTCPGTGYSLAITSGGLLFQGASTQTVLQFNNGTCDDWKIGYQTGQIAQITFQRLYFNHSGKTGGISMDVKNVAYLYLDDVIIDHPWNGLYYEKVNTTFVQNVLVNVPGGAYGVKLYADPASDNSSGLNFNELTVSCGYSGADALLIDGYVTTPRFDGGALLSCRYGIRSLNTAASANIPSFARFNRIEIDGMSTQAVDLQSFADYAFSIPDISNTSGASGQGSADVQTFSCSPDSGRSTLLTINGGRIVNSQRQAAIFNCNDVTVNGTVFTDASKAGVNSYSMVEVGASANRVLLNGIIAGATTGVTPRTQYGVLIDNGAVAAQVFASNLQGNSTGAYNNLSTDAGTYLCNIIGASVNLDCGSNVAGAVVVRDINVASGVTVSVARRLQTGTANSTYDYGLSDNNGTPFLRELAGTAVTQKFVDVNTHLWRNQAGSNQATLDSTSFTLYNGLIKQNSGNLSIHAASAQTLILGTTAADTVYINNGAEFPATDGGASSGAASQRWTAVFLKPTAFASLPACGSTTAGAHASVSDSSVTTWGSNVAAGGSTNVGVYCNGSNWTVESK